MARDARIDFRIGRRAKPTEADRFVWMFHRFEDIDTPVDRKNTRTGGPVGD